MRHAEYSKIKKFASRRTENEEIIARIVREKRKWFGRVIRMKNQQNTRMET